MHKTDKTATSPSSQKGNNTKKKIKEKRKQKRTDGNSLEMSPEPKCQISLDTKIIKTCMFFLVQYLSKLQLFQKLTSSGNDFNKTICKR